MTRFISYITTILLLVDFQNLAAQTNLLDFENSLKFARYLNTTRQFDFAAQEYERINYLWPNDSAVTMELTQTYRQNKKCEKIDYSFKLLSENNRILNYNEVSLEYLRFALTCKQKDQNYFDLVQKLIPEERAFYTLSYFWINNQQDSLKRYFSSNEELIKRANLNLYEITESLYSQKYKSPFLASIMSAVVPGSGKAYSKRWGDAFVSFLFVGTNSYAAYRAFKKKGASSLNGWIFGTFAFSFYSANIWGSGKAAKNYNAKLKEIQQLNAESYIYRTF